MESHIVPAFINPIRLSIPLDFVWELGFGGEGRKCLWGDKHCLEV